MLTGLSIFLLPVSVIYILEIRSRYFMPTFVASATAFDLLDVMEIAQAYLFARPLSLFLRVSGLAIGIVGAISGAVASRERWH